MHVARYRVTAVHGCVDEEEFSGLMRRSETEGKTWRKRRK